MRSIKRFSLEAELKYLKIIKQDSHLWQTAEHLVLNVSCTNIPKFVNLRISKINKPRYRFVLQSMSQTAITLDWYTGDKK